MKLAVRWKVKIKGTKRSIQLFDKDGNKLKGSEARWEGTFDCSYTLLTSLEGSPKEVGGGFYCNNNNLTSLEGSPKEVGGGFYCHNNQLTSLEGAPKEIGGGFYCNYNNLTSLEGAPKEVGGSFYCNDNQLTSLEGSPREVGGIFYCYNNQLTSLEGQPKVNSNLFESYLKRGYVFADNILAKLISKRGNVFKVRLIGQKEYSYVIRQGEVFSHGKTLKEARDSLIYKISSRDTTKFKKWKLNDKKTLVELIEAYRVITGACELGVKEFVKNSVKEKTYTVKEVIKLTKNQFGNEEFARFFE